VQTLTGPSGVKVSASTTNPYPDGRQLSGPTGSVAVGLVVQNGGPGVFLSSPQSQVTVVDSAGTTYHPVPTTYVNTGKATTLPAGSELRMILFFLPPTGVQLKTLEFAPFGPSGGTLRWGL
jgi:hypothetical protein